MRRMLEAADLPVPQSTEPELDQAKKARDKPWWISDDALWNPFEVLHFALWIVLGFGYLLGRKNYAFAFELFALAIVFASIVVIVQALARRSIGAPNVFRVLRDRIG